MKRLLIALSIVVLLASCATSEKESMDNTKMVIALSENPSTGYSWSWDQMGAGELIAVSDEFTPGDENLVGASGTREFTFAGTKPGHVTLTLSYGRPWEDTEEESIVYSVTVHNDMTISYL